VSRKEECRAALVKHKGNVDRAANALLNKPEPKPKPKPKAAAAKPKKKEARSSARTKAEKQPPKPVKPLFPPKPREEKKKRLEEQKHVPAEPAKEEEDGKEIEGREEEEEIEGSEGLTNDDVYGTPSPKRTLRSSTPVADGACPSTEASKIVVKKTAAPPTKGTPADTNKATAKKPHKYHDKAEQLVSMLEGVHYDACIKALSRFKGSLPKACDLLCRKQEQHQEEAEEAEEEAVDGNPVEEEPAVQPPAASQPKKKLKRLRQNRDSSDEEEEEEAEEPAAKAPPYAKAKRTTRSSSEFVAVTPAPKKGRLSGAAASKGRAKPVEKEEEDNNQKKKPLSPFSAARATPKPNLRAQRGSKKPPVKAKPEEQAGPSTAKAPAVDDQLSTPAVSRRRGAAATPSVVEKPKAPKRKATEDAKESPTGEMTALDKRTSQKRHRPSQATQITAKEKKEKKEADEDRPRGAGAVPSRVIVSSNQAENGLKTVVQAAVHELGGRDYVFYEPGATKELKQHDIVVSADGRRTLKVLQGLAVGAWVVKQEWAQKSLANGAWEPLERYVYTGKEKDTNGDRIKITGVMAAKQAAKQKAPLLANHHIHVKGSTAPKKSALEKLIVAAGGKVATTAKRATHCILGHDASLPSGVEVDKVPCVTDKWVLDSLAAHSIADVECYRCPQQTDGNESDVY